MVYAWFVATREEPIDTTIVEITRWVLVILGAYLLSNGILGFIAVFLFTQALYVPVFNKFSGKETWFIDDDTWLGRQIIEYLGEGSGRVWFWIQVVAAIILLIL